jgi:hypothetical protein
MTDIGMDDDDAAEWNASDDVSPVIDVIETVDISLTANASSLRLGVIQIYG